MVSKGAQSFRQQLCAILADILYQCMIEIFGQGITRSRNSELILANGPGNKESFLSSTLSLPSYDYNSIFRDRRLKVIYSKTLKSARGDPILMLRFFWASIIIIITASTLACQRVFVALSVVYLRPIFDSPRRYVVSA